MVIDREFATDGHVVRLAVEQTSQGWLVEEQRDSAIVHVEHHNDWHRVERAMRRLEMKARRAFNGPLQPGAKTVSYGRPGAAR